MIYAQISEDGKISSLSILAGEVQDDELIEITIEDYFKFSSNIQGYRYKDNKFIEENI